MKGAGEHKVKQGEYPASREAWKLVSCYRELLLLGLKEAQQEPGIPPRFPGWREVNIFPENALYTQQKLHKAPTAQRTSQRAAE